MEHNRFEFTLSNRYLEITCQELTSTLSSVVVGILPRTREKNVILNRSTCRPRRFEFDQTKAIATPLE
jgi:hypothetical protein